MEIDLRSQKNFPRSNQNFQHLDPFSIDLLPLFLELGKIPVPMETELPSHQILNLIPLATKLLRSRQSSMLSQSTQMSDIVPSPFHPISSRGGIIGDPNVKTTRIIIPGGEMHMIAISGSYSRGSKIF